MVHLGRARRIAGGFLLVAALASPGLPAEEEAPAAPLSASQLQRMIEEQEKLIREQAARIAQLEARIGAGAPADEALKSRIAELEASLVAMEEELAVIRGELPAAEQQKALADRLERVEKAAAEAPELPEGVVSAGDFPGSIRIPGTDSAIKFGGRVRTAAVFTLGPLGSEDRFLTHSIPVEPDDEAAGKGRRTTFSANTSRFNFELRTPTGAGHMRAFLEGDFFGSTGTEERIAFRLRHAFAQFRGVLVGQTWSTFSDPAADHQDLDFEGINGENVIRQAQFRYTWSFPDGSSVAVAAEEPEVSLTGGRGVNLVPDLVGRAVWPVLETGHLQAAAVVREIRGEWDVDPSVPRTASAWGGSLSGVVPFRYRDLADRFIFQLNFGRGIARYINDLNSLGGQDAVFDDATGDLEALPAIGWYVAYEHQWKHWQTTRTMNLRSSLIWSFVEVGNLAPQPGDAYQRTSRLSVNLIFSPIKRIDVGIEYIWGSRENKNGNRGTSDQFQAVGIFRF